MADDNTGTNAKFYVQADGTTASRSFFSEEFTISDDDYTEIGSSVDGFAFVIIVAKSTNSMAGFALKTDPIAAVSKALGATIWDVGNGEPTGTTGDDNNYTVFADGTSDNFFIENRIGQQENFKILLIY